jgi:Membrane-bound metallopeptidase
MTKTFIISLLFFAMLLPANAQTRKELEKQRREALEQIEITNKLLDETKKSQSSSLNKLNILNKNINERKKLITNMSGEINLLDREVARLNRESQNLNKKLNELKADYARLIDETRYKDNAYTKIMFVLSAEDFQQSFRRFRYLHEFTEYRKNQVKEIEQTKTLIALKTDSLAKNKTQKSEVLKQQEKENETLAKDRQKETTLYKALDKEKTKLQADIKAQQKKATQLNNKIDQLIAEEIRKAEERAKAQQAQTTTAKKDPEQKGSENIELTKEQKLISGNFEANKGRLPWPVAKGFISGHYGKQKHPVLQYVTVDNKGIYIQTTANSDARAVFDGVVTQCFSVPGSGNAIIIAHGDYRTVYSNLSDIYVKANDKVKAKQAIGKIFTDSESDNKTELYFQVRKGMTLLNPEVWITR